MAMASAGPTRNRANACSALADLAAALAGANPPPAPRAFLILLGERAAGIRRGPCAVYDLLRGGANSLPGGGFRADYDDATRGQARHFAGMARAVTLLGVQGTAWLCVHLLRDAPDSADGRLSAAAIRFASLLLSGELAVVDTADWLHATLCAAPR